MGTVEVSQFKSQSDFSWTIIGNMEGLEGRFIIVWDSLVVRSRTQSWESNPRPLISLENA